MCGASTVFGLLCLCNKLVRCLVAAPVTMRTFSFDIFLALLGADFQTLAVGNVQHGARSCGLSGFRLCVHTLSPFWGRSTGPHRQYSPAHEH